MSEPIFSIITVVQENSAAADRNLRMTAKSIAVQQHFTNMEWLVIETAPLTTAAEIISEHATEALKIIRTEQATLFDAKNNALSMATGRYVWFLNPGDCLSDAYVLRDIAKQIQYNLAPDFIYADIRENSRIRKARSANSFARGVITHPCAMIYRRPIIADVKFNPAYELSADYAFMLEALANAKKTFHFPRIICDLVSPDISELKVKEIYWQNYYIRRDLLQMNSMKNKINLYLDQIGCFIKTKLPFIYRLTAR